MNRSVPPPRSISYTGSLGLEIPARALYFIAYSAVDRATDQRRILGSVLILGLMVERC